MISQKFIDECKNPAYGNRTYSLYFSRPNQINIREFKSFEIQSSCYNNGEIIGIVHPRSLKIDVNEAINGAEGKQVRVSSGVRYSDSKSESVTQGKFIIERPEVTNTKTILNGYDKLYQNLDKTYICNLDYENNIITLKDLYEDVCSNLGLSPSTLEITNKDIPILNNPFTNNESNRTVLETVAKVACSFVSFNDVGNVNDLVNLSWLHTGEDIDYTFDLHDYSTLEGGDITVGPINCLVIKSSQVSDENITIKDEDSISVHGENTLVITEDYILHNATLRNAALPAIWDKVRGLKYVDCKLTTYYGKPFLNLGDKIRIYTSATEYFDTYVLKHTFINDGTFTSIIESPALSKEEVNKKQNVTLKDILTKVQIDIDKQNKKIESTVEDVTNIKSSVELVKYVGGKNHLYLPYSDNREFVSEIITGNNIVGLTNYFDDTIEPDYANKATWHKIKDGLRVSVATAGTNRYVVIPLNNSDELLGKTITIKCDTFASKMQSTRVKLYWKKSDNKILSSIGSSLNPEISNKQTINIPSEYPEGAVGLTLMFYANLDNSDIIAEDYVDFTNVLVSIDSEEYVPYGTWIKQINTGKNLIDVPENVVTTSNYLKVINCEGGKDYTFLVSQTLTEESSSGQLISRHRYKFIDANGTKLDSGEFAAITFSEVGETIENYETIKAPDQAATLTLDIGCFYDGDKEIKMITNYAQLETGNVVTKYENYQENVSYIPFNNVSCLQYENVSDEIELSNGYAYLHKKVGIENNNLYLLSDPYTINLGEVINYPHGYEFDTNVFISNKDISNVSIKYFTPFKPDSNKEIISSYYEPKDKSKLWLDLNDENIKIYKEDDGWIKINDYTTILDNSNLKLDEIKKRLESQLNDLDKYIKQVDEKNSTKMTQTDEEFEFRFNQITTTINGTLNELQNHIQTQETFIRFVEGNIILGDINEEYSLKIENDQINIYYKDTPISNWNKHTFTAKEINIGSSNDYFAFIPRPNGSLSFKKVGDING